jgi:hypothetical protein
MCNPFSSTWYANQRLCACYRPQECPCNDVHGSEHRVTHSAQLGMQTSVFVLVVDHKNAPAMMCMAQSTMQPIQLNLVCKPASLCLLDHKNAPDVERLQLLMLMM